MNGRKAKAKRRDQMPGVAQAVRELRAESPQHRTAHPLGEYVGAYEQWQDNMKRVLLTEIAKSKKEQA